MKSFWARIRRDEVLLPVNFWTGYRLAKKSAEEDSSESDITSSLDDDDADYGTFSTDISEEPSFIESIKKGSFFIRALVDLYTEDIGGEETIKVGENPRRKFKPVLDKTGKQMCVVIDCYKMPLAEPYLLFHLECKQKPNMYKFKQDGVAFEHYSVYKITDIDMLLLNPTDPRHHKIIEYIIRDEGELDEKTADEWTRQVIECHRLRQVDIGYAKCIEQSPFMDNVLSETDIMFALAIPEQDRIRIRKNLEKVLVYTQNVSSNDGDDDDGEKEDGNNGITTTKKAMDEEGLELSNIDHTDMIYRIASEMIEENDSSENDPKQMVIDRIFNSGYFVYLMVEDLLNQYSGVLNVNRSWLYRKSSTTWCVNFRKQVEEAPWEFLSRRMRREYHVEGMTISQFDRLKTLHVAKCNKNKEPCKFEVFYHYAFCIMDVLTNFDKNRDLEGHLYMRLDNLIAEMKRRLRMNRSVALCMRSFTNDTNVSIEHAKKNDMDRFVLITRAIDWLAKRGEIVITAPPSEAARIFAGDNEHDESLSYQQKMRIVMRTDIEPNLTSADRVYLKPTWKQQSSLLRFLAKLLSSEEFVLPYKRLLNSGAKSSDTIVTASPQPKGDQNQDNVERDDDNSDSDEKMPLPMTNDVDKEYADSIVESLLASAPPMEYNKEQREAIETIAKKPLLLLNGPPGCGKTEILRALRIMAVSAQQWLYGGTFFGRTSAMHRDRLDIPNINRIDGDIASQKYAVAMTIHMAHHNKHKSKLGPLFDEYVTVGAVDEAQTIPLKLMWMASDLFNMDIMKKLVLAGDETQIYPISDGRSGKVYHDLLGALHEYSVKLVQNTRVMKCPETASILEYTKIAMERRGFGGRNEKDLSDLGSSFVTFRDDEQIMDYIVSFFKEHVDEYDDIMVITPSKATRNAINDRVGDRIRDMVLRYENTWDREEQVYTAPHISPGSRVCITKNIPEKLVPLRKESERLINDLNKGKMDENDAKMHLMSLERAELIDMLTGDVVSIEPELRRDIDPFSHQKNKSAGFHRQQQQQFVRASSLVKQQQQQHSPVAKKNIYGKNSTVNPVGNNNRNRFNGQPQRYAGSQRKTYSAVGDYIKSDAVSNGDAEWVDSVKTIRSDITGRTLWVVHFRSGKTIVVGDDHISPSYIVKGYVTTVASQIGTQKKYCLVCFQGEKILKWHDYRSFVVACSRATRRLEVLSRPAMLRGEEMKSLLDRQLARIAENRRLQAEEFAECKNVLIDKIVSKAHDPSIYEFDSIIKDEEMARKNAELMIIKKKKQVQGANAHCLDVVQQSEIMLANESPFRCSDIKPYLLILKQALNAGSDGDGDDNIAQFSEHYLAFLSGVKIKEEGEAQGAGDENTGEEEENGDEEDIIRETTLQRDPEENDNSEQNKEILDELGCGNEDEAYDLLFGEGRHHHQQMSPTRKRLSDDEMNQEVAKEEPAEKRTRY